MGAHFPSSLTFYYYGGNPDIQHEYIELQSEWKQIGLNVKIIGLPYDSFANHLTKPTLSLTYQGGDPWVEWTWIDDYPDAQDFTTNLFSPITAFNVGNYNNPSFERLITQGLTARGPERAQLYIKASRIALNDVALSMIGQQTANWRWGQNITGMTLWSGELFPMPANHDWTNVDVR
jgi:ABC-type transport system substrate-binding protein